MNTEDKLETAKKEYRVKTTAIMIRRGDVAEALGKAIDKSEELQKLILKHPMVLVMTALFAKSIEDELFDEFENFHSSIKRGEE